MKKSYVLSGIMMLSIILGINAMQQQRPAMYTMIDPLLTKMKQKYSENTPDWPAIFAILDSMQGRIDVNEYRDPKGDTLLIIAARQDNLFAVKTLLEKYKANPNIPSVSEKYMKWTALMEAAARSLAMVKLLLLHGANPNLKDAKGRTALNHATKWDMPENVDELAKVTK